MKVKKYSTASTILSVVFVAICLFWIMPVIEVVINSLKSNNAINMDVFALPNSESFVGLQNYLTGMTYRSTEYPVTEEEGTFRVDTTDMDREELKEFREREPAVNISLFEILDMTNYNYPGVYEIQFTLSDDDGNRGRAILTVVVEE